MDKRERQTYQVTLIGSLGNLLLMLFKFAAGFLGHSSAMIADAVHSLSDFITDIVVVMFVKISSKPSDESHDYGHGKYETLATVIISVMLLGVGVAILWSGATKIYDYICGRELPEPGMIALIAALVSIVVKEGLYRYTVIVGRRINSQVVVANAWHHRSDALSSIGTTAGIAGAIFFGVKGRVLDPLAAVVVSVFIVKVALQLLKPALDELMERSLPADIEDKILEAVSDIDEVSSPHNLRTRRIGNHAAVEMHVRMPADMTVGRSHEITREIERRIRRLLGDGTFISIHVEPQK